MEKNITKIPATRSMFTDSDLRQQNIRRVAAYARVSTDHEEQTSSYEAQVAYYTNYINRRSDWKLVKVYADEGVTGCNTKRREGFKNMVDDALSGHIDLIITKSVSRFARNTVDSLTTIRKLKEHNVECYFEKENIWTFDGKGELLLTIMSSIAQEESRSISENCTWGQRRRFEQGKYSVPFKRFLGYDMGKNGELIINHEQAKIVKRIFAEYIKGSSSHQIAKGLTADGIPTPGGKEKWHSGVIRNILRNEKYKGDALLQKVYTSDFLTKKKVKNTGQVPQYYIKDDHEAIIEREVFDLVQRKLEQQSKKRSCKVHLFSGKLICGNCGGIYGSKTWHSNDKYKKVVWQCNDKFKGKKCSTPTLSEDEIKTHFISAVNKLIAKKHQVIEAYETIIGDIYSTEKLEIKLSAANDEIKSIEEQIEKLIKENAARPLDQTEYEKKNKELFEKLDSAQAKHSELAIELHEVQEKRKDLERFLSQLKAAKAITEFDENLWTSMVDHATVYSKDKVIFTFNDGTEI